MNHEMALVVPFDQLVVHCTSMWVMSLAFRYVNGKQSAKAEKLERFRSLLVPYSYSYSERKH